MLLHPLIMFMFLCAGVFMAGWTFHVVAATIISSTIQAPALRTGATIRTPTTGTSLAASTTHVTGECPSQSYVALQVNGAFNGVSWCDNSNTYDIATSLHGGTNTLAVQAYNETDLQGPTTPTVQVVYAPPVSASASSTASGTSRTSATPSSSSSTAALPAPLLLTSSFQFHTFTTQKAFTWDLDLEGGNPPYDVNIDWGDGTKGHMRFPGDPVFTLSHAYKTDGYYAVVVNSIDTAGQQHVMQLAALITKKDGTANFLGTAPGNQTNTPSSQGGSRSAPANSNPFTNAASNSTSATHMLLVAWPSYIIVILMMVSFWLGEKREIGMLLARPRRQHRH